METVLIRCPHCKEEMQAPVGRDSIICMFCGEKIDLREAERVKEAESADGKADGTQIDGTHASGLQAGNKQAGGTQADVAEENPADRKKREENLQFVLEHAPAVCKGYGDRIKGFKKDSYGGSFQRFQEENYAFFAAIKQILSSTKEEELDDTCSMIAGAFIKDQEEKLAQVKRKNDKAAVQMEKNMFMAVFVLPGIKDLKEERADYLADAICREWGKSFKNSNILASDYESIQGGFKKKLCYITTAVCRNLHMAEDCEELQLIKAFRDDVLSATEEGKALVEEYYDIAPTLVKRIAKDAAAQEKYVWLWNTYLAPCVAFIKAGNQEACKEKYCSMVEELKKEYVIYDKKECREEDKKEASRG